MSDEAIIPVVVAFLTAAGIIAAVATYDDEKDSSKAPSKARQENSSGMQYNPSTGAITPYMGTPGTIPF